MKEEKEELVVEHNKLNQHFMFHFLLSTNSKCRVEKCMNTIVVINMNAK